MNLRYKRLIFLAEAIDTPQMRETLIELNSLLALLSANQIEEEHLPLLDSLICFLLNTNNIYSEHHSAILRLQDDIRSKIYAT